MVVPLLSFIGYGVLSVSIGSHGITHKRVLTWMRRTFAAAFVALGAKLAFANR